MKNRIIYLLMSILVSIKMFAQVNPATGSVSANIPLYSYTGPNRLAVSVDLSYTASNGVKVNQIASQVGLGWELKAGGRISRIPADKPDDQYGSLSAAGPRGRMYTRNSLVTSCRSDIGVSRKEIYGWDREADIFSFDFNGRTGTFFIGTKKVGDTEYPIICTSDSKLKIHLIERDMSSSNIITRINSFYITTEDGTEYWFSDKELTEIFTSDVAYATETPNSVIIISANGTVPSSSTVTVPTYHTGKYCVNNWYLTSIRNPLTDHSITFNYDTYNLGLTYLKLPIKTATLDKDFQIDKINYTVVNQQYAGIMKRLSNITIENRLISIDFTYDGNRTDIPGEYALTGVKVTNGTTGAVLQDYRLNYQYWAVNSIIPYADGASQSASLQANLRLGLKSVDNLVGGTKTLYSIDYVAGRMPGRGSMWQDMYGYGFGSFAYDRALNDFFDEAKRLPAATNPLTSGVMAAANGLLQRINYASGGYMQYDYENNSYFDGTSDRVYGGVRVKSTTLYDGIDHANDQVVTYKYIKENGQSSGVGAENPTYTQDISTTFYAAGTHLSSVAICSFLNLALSTYTGFGSEVFSMAGNSSGLLPAIDEVISTLVGNATTSGSYYTRSWASYPLYSNNSLPFYYNRVEQIQGTESNNQGKVVMDFVDFQDRPALLKDYGTPYSYQQRIEGASIGQAKRVSYYNGNGDLVKEELNEYNHNYRELVDTSLLSCKCFARLRIIPAAAEPAGTSTAYLFDSTIYYPVVGRSELTKTTTRVYFPDGNSTETQQLYDYDPDYYNLRKVTTTTSLNQKREKRIYYPYDYTGNTTLSQMVTNNMISLPVATEEWLIDQDNTAKIVDGSIENFKVLGSGDIKSSSTFIFNSNKPVAESTIGAFNHTLNRAPSYFKEEAQLVRDNQDNIIETNAKGVVSSYKYDGEKHMTASIINATAAETAFTSFEPNSAGGWVLSNAPAVDETNEILRTPGPMTGDYFYYLTDNSITKSATGMVPGKKYIISYWVTSFPLVQTLTPATLNYTNTIKSLYRYGTYVLYEHEFTMGTEDIVISGNSPIDNLRLYPADALMTTNVYDSYGRVSVRMGPNYGLLKYQYDEKGRVINVFDQYSLIKHYEYNY